MAEEERWMQIWSIMQSAPEMAEEEGWMQI
jgi:hypothetical protein